MEKKLNAVLSSQCDDVDLAIIVTHSDEVDNKETLRQIVSDIQENVQEQLQDCADGELAVKNSH